VRANIALSTIAAMPHVLSLMRRGKQSLPTYAISNTQTNVEQHVNTVVGWINRTKSD